MRVSDWRASGKRFDHAGRSFFYQEGGAGPPLLLIHGFPTSSWDWHRIWGELGRRFRLIAPDMLGFGFSPKPRWHRYAMSEQADLHEALLAQLGVPRVHVLAHDYGDTVAQELLARHEERCAHGNGAAGAPWIESVVFLNGGLFPEAHRPRRVQTLLAGPFGPLLSLLSSRRAFGSGFSAIFGPRTKPSEAELDEFWTLLTHDGGHRIGHKLIRYMEERRTHRERWVGALQRTAVPRRLIDGPEDPVSGAHLAARYQELVPGADVVLLPGIGHYPQVEDPAGVLAAFFAFHDGLGT